MPRCGVVYRYSRLWHSSIAVKIRLRKLNAGNIPSTSVGILLACCQGFVVADKEASATVLG